MSEIDDYISGFPAETRALLADVRAALLRAVPGGEEKIRYGMPSVLLGGRYAIHYAAWKKHLGLYPVGVLSPALEAEIAPFRAAKDSVNFVYTKPVPLDLIERVAAELNARHSARGD